MIWLFSSWNYNPILDLMKMSLFTSWVVLFSLTFLNLKMTSLHLGVSLLSKTFLDLMKMTSLFTARNKSLILNCLKLDDFFMSYNKSLILGFLRLAENDLFTSWSKSLIIDFLRLYEDDLFTSWSTSLILDFRRLDEDEFFMSWSKPLILDFLKLDEDDFFYILKQASYLRVDEDDFIVNFLKKLVTLKLDEVETSLLAFWHGYPIWAFPKMILLLMFWNGFLYLRRLYSSFLGICLLRSQDFCINNIFYLIDIPVDGMNSDWLLTLHNLRHRALHLHILLTNLLTHLNAYLLRSANKLPLLVF